MVAKTRNTISATLNKKVSIAMMIMVVYLPVFEPLMRKGAGVLTPAP
jgi:hypothetical protein